MQHEQWPKAAQTLTTPPTEAVFEEVEYRRALDAIHVFLFELDEHMPAGADLVSALLTGKYPTLEALYAACGRNPQNGRVSLLSAAAAIGKHIANNHELLEALNLPPHARPAPFRSASDLSDLLTPRE